ncbi:MAG: hypothetical protein RLZZ324_993 [Candidatus Parcubacteria bacterium]|jgi:hypothetical protein
MPEETMKALIIQEPWIGKILAGEKTWEIRRRKTNIRGRIGLIRSKSGLILGTANLVDCIPAPHALLARNMTKHRCTMEMLRAYGETLYAWVLEDRKPFATPVPYDHPQGAVIWVTVPKAGGR